MPPPRPGSAVVGPTPISAPTTTFSLPEGHHLLITTSRNIFAWDAAGIGPVFGSRRAGIVAARAAKDDSGFLAIAGKNVVVLHDTKRGQERSWGLNGDEDTVRLLEYSSDGKSLFLSTTNAGAIQRYSTQHSRLLSPVQAHVSPPTALAVSCTGHLLLSASNDPPAVYVKGHVHSSPPILLQPNASKSAVTHITFHPERQNIFLLAYRDGTLAAYDATKLLPKRIHDDAQNLTSDGEISHFDSLHRIVSNADTGKSPAPIVGAAFLPGYRTRAVTAGRDGKCRIMDFINGGAILRTWHVKAEVTSLAVLGVKQERTSHEGGAGIARSRKSRPVKIGGPTSTNNVIAVSRIDGQVHIFDGVGQALHQKTITSAEEKILSVEWVKGHCPPTFATHDIQRRLSDEAVSFSLPLSSSPDAKDPKNTDPQREDPLLKTSMAQSNLGLPSSLRKVKDTPASRGTRKFTIHPDEVADSTVHYVPSTKKGQAPVAANAFSDLFSPVKPTQQATDATSKLRVSSPPRSRPRISSQTFQGVPTLDVAQGDTTVETDMVRNPAAPSVPPRDPKVPTRIAPDVPRMQSKKRHVTFQSDSTHSSAETVKRNTIPARSSAKVLADIRHLASYDGSSRRQCILSSYARSQGALPPDVDDTASTVEQPTHSAAPPRMAHRRKIHVNYRDTWPTDSNQATSLDDAGEDIWLTSESDVSTFVKRKRTLKTRPTVGQKRHFQGDGDEVAQSRAENTSAKSKAWPRPMDGSVEDANCPAYAPGSPHGIFSPTSDDLRGLFPRSSSLSPRKKKRATEKLITRSPRKREENGRTLTRTAANAAQVREFWRMARDEKAKAVYCMTSDVENLSPDATLDGPAHSSSNACLSCLNTKARVQTLEDEVAHLKGEVLALKATLRRSGLPLPDSSIR